MKNNEIRNQLKSEKILMCDVAEEIGIHKKTFSRWLREELSPDKKITVLSTIEKIKLNRLKNK